MSMIRIRPQYIGVAEQILLSASNMVVSVVVVKIAGLEWFGIYSFIFALTTLASAFLSTLLHRQMILIIASSTTENRRRVFIATLAIQAVVIVGLGGVLAVFVSLYPDLWLVSNFTYEIIAAAIFIGLYNFYDLCRQYLYVLDGQAYSLRCTTVYVIALVIGVFWVVENIQPIEAVAGMYGVFSIALLISLLSNRRCYQECFQGEWISWKYVQEILKSYFEQGRFRLVGMMVTWAQNQSMNPVLMWLGGPLIAGYFSMARLMVMPMAVVNHGLTNSTTPQLRRVYEARGADDLHQGIAYYSRLNMLLSTAYLLLLFIAHTTGILNSFVPEYAAVKWYLMIWIVTLLVTMYRHWLTQFFVVSMQFRFLMNVSIAALAVSMTGMISAGYFLENVYLALVFVVVGEVLSIVLFKIQLSSDTK
jgi:O-antigen/teichoic acid export membrane protein